MSNSLWAYAKLGYNPGSRLLDVTAHRATSMLHQYTSQEIANTLWALSTLEHHPGSRLLDAAAVQIARRVEQFSPQVCRHICTCLGRYRWPWSAGKCSVGFGCCAGVSCPMMRVQKINCSGTECLGASMGVEVCRWHLLALAARGGDCKVVANAPTLLLLELQWAHLHRPCLCPPFAFARWLIAFDAMITLWLFCSGWGHDITSH